MPLNDDFLAVFRPFYELRHVLDEFRDAYIHNRIIQSLNYNI